MRNRIQMYSHSGTEAYVAVSVISGIVAFISFMWGVIALADPTVSNGYGFVLLGMLPLVINLFLYVNHYSRGLNHYQRDLLAQYMKMPKHLRKEMPLTRIDVKRMTNDDCWTLENKMGKVLSRHMRDYNGVVGRANQYLDSMIEVYDEMGVK